MCGVMKLNRMGMAGFLWVTQESSYIESNGCMFVVWEIRAGGSKWLGNGLFVLEESLKEGKLPLSATCYAALFFICVYVQMDISKS